MVLRFYRGGPVAAKGHMYWVAADGTFGCAVASGVGAIIPRSTYLNADPDVSELQSGKVGLNHTALLPIEE